MAAAAAAAAAAHLAADAEGLERVEAEPARAAGLLEAAHELGVERPLQRGQPHQDHLLLLGRQLAPQDVVAPPWSQKKTRWVWRKVLGKENKEGWRLDRNL